MRCVRFLLMLAYIAGHTGLPLGVPPAGCACHASGHACHCGHGQCANRRLGAEQKEKPSCCQTGTKSCCRSGSRSCCDSRRADKRETDKQNDHAPAIVPCGCQHNLIVGFVSCGDPRLVPQLAALPDDRNADRLAAASAPAAPLVIHSPDDPVPRLSPATVYVIL